MARGTNTNTAWMGTTSPNNDANAVAPPATQGSGPDRMRATLSTYGLESMSDRAWEYVQANKPSEAEFAYWLRQQPEYKARFPGMEALSKQGRAIDEGTYINLERQYIGAFREAGLPAGFYDTPDDFANYISNNVSPVELQARLDEYKLITYQLPPIVRDELGRQYGLTAGDITAFVIDPNRALPLLHQQVLAAQAGAAARQAGYGNLLASEAEGLAQFGVDFGAAVQGFGQLVNQHELFQPLVGDSGENAITREEQLAGTFAGNANAARRIEERARKRAATFKEGGGYSGFGTAET